MSVVHGVAARFCNPPQARSSFEPVLDALRVRTVHVMKRLFGVVEHMLTADGLHMSEAHQKPFGESIHSSAAMVVQKLQEKENELNFPVATPTLSFPRAWKTDVAS